MPEEQEWSTQHEWRTALFHEVRQSRKDLDGLTTKIDALTNGLNAIVLELARANITKLGERVEDCERCIEEIRSKQESFEPVRKIVYSAVGVILLSVFTALVALVIKVSN